MSAISNSGKLIFRLHQKRITSMEIIDFLKQLLKHHKYRNMVVVMDMATPHISKKRNHLSMSKKGYVFSIYLRAHLTLIQMNKYGTI